MNALVDYIDENSQKLSHIEHFLISTRNVTVRRYSDDITYTNKTSQGYGRECFGNNLLEQATEALTSLPRTLRTIIADNYAQDGLRFKDFINGQTHLEFLGCSANILSDL